jgi:hypothetical protein
LETVSAYSTGMRRSNRSYHFRIIILGQFTLASIGHALKGLPEMGPKPLFRLHQITKHHDALPVG